MFLLFCKIGTGLSGADLVKTYDKIISQFNASPNQDKSLQEVAMCFLFQMFNELCSKISGLLDESDEEDEEDDINPSSALDDAVAAALKDVNPDEGIARLAREMNEDVSAQNHVLALVSKVRDNCFNF